MFLRKYHASTLSAEDAKAIHKSLRDIGIPGNRTEDDLLKAMCFDPEVLKKLDHHRINTETILETNSKMKGRRNRTQRK